MENKVIVPESGTQNELAGIFKGQQNPEKIKEEQTAKQRCRNRRNNAKGHSFEDKILAGCALYSEHGTAWINKTPEPFRVMKKSKDGMFTGRFTAKAQPDFQGTLYGGRSIVFEAKSTDNDRITQNVLTETQMEILEKHNRIGALCGVCICIQDKYYFVPWKLWRDMKELYGRKYLKAEDIEEYKVIYDGAVHFLQHMTYDNLGLPNPSRKKPIRRDK